MRWQTETEPNKIELLKPKLATPFPNIPKIWTCPITGLKVPKIPAENLEYRARLLKRAESDTLLQQDLMTASSLSPLFWINTFAFTFRQKEVDPITHQERPVKHSNVPFVTWPIQDELINEAVSHIDGGKDLGCDKSRDMGASWIFIAILHSYWLFYTDAKILELSRTEDYVDKTGNQKAMFWKHDYLNNWLPDWMRPPGVASGEKNRSKMRLHNELNGSTIEGESTTKNAARGDRRLVVLLDEFAAVENGAAMRSATSDVTSCRLINSTPQGPGTEYSKWVLSGQLDVFDLSWYEHPEKGLGRYVNYDKDAKKWEILSPWYLNERKRRSPQEMAQEIDHCHVSSGAIFFERTIVETHKILYGRDPHVRLNVDFIKKVPNDSLSKLIKLKDTSKLTYKAEKDGKLKVWTNLVFGRPDQTKTYTIGCDISKGQAASNSIASIKCNETGEKIAEWADARTPPYDFARIVVALALWCGGANPRRLPFIIWEANGDPGIDFGKLLVLIFCYPYYYVDESTGKTTAKKNKKYGFHSSRIKKQELLTTYRRALALGGYINHSIRALEEALVYIYYDSGAIGPACLEEENTAAKATHGDRVIADALTTWPGREAGVTKTTPVKPPANSIGYRKEKVLRILKNKRKNSTTWQHSYDFAGKN